MDLGPRLSIQAGSRGKVREESQETPRGVIHRLKLAQRIGEEMRRRTTVSIRGEHDHLRMGRGTPNDPQSPDQQQGPRFPRPGGSLSRCV